MYNFKYQACGCRRRRYHRVGVRFLRFSMLSLSVPDEYPEGKGARMEFTGSRSQESGQNLDKEPRWFTHRIRLLILIPSPFPKTAVSAPSQQRGGSVRMREQLVGGGFPCQSPDAGRGVSCPIRSRPWMCGPATPMWDTKRRSVDQ